MSSYPPEIAASPAATSIGRGWLMAATVAEPERSFAAERVRFLWTRSGSTSETDALVLENPAGLLVDLDRELEFLLAPRDPSMDSVSVTNDACCTFSNQSNCCPTVALSVTHCCE
jgi:hypothetical protein